MQAQLVQNGGWGWGRGKEGGPNWVGPSMEPSECGPNDWMGVGKALHQLLLGCVASHELLLACVALHTLLLGGVTLHTSL